MTSAQDLAFNVALVAYDYDYPKRVRRQLLAYCKIGKLSTTDKSADLLQRRVPNIAPGEAEVSSRSKSNIGLWVGM